MYWGKKCPFSLIYNLNVTNYLCGVALKTIRVSDSVHQKLTRLLGEQMAKTGKAQTFNDVINDLLDRSRENAAH